MSRQPLLIFTDLDGSLLNHDDYNFDAAKPLLNHLQEAHIPVIANTSKTRAEQIALRQRLDNHHPFIAENGAAVFIPAGYFEHSLEGCFLQDHYWVKAFVEPRAHWQALLRSLPPTMRAAYESFSYMGVDGIMQRTGLSNIDANRASQREYGEPIAWCSGNELKQEFIATVSAAGANVLEGGRFMHISGHCNKGKAMQWLSQQYAIAHNGARPITVAVGDSDNDIAMLNSADYAIVVKAPNKPYPALAASGIVIETLALAPEGWAEGVSKALTLIRTIQS